MLFLSFIPLLVTCLFKTIIQKLNLIFMIFFFCKTCNVSGVSARWMDLTRAGGLAI